MPEISDQQAEQIKQQLLQQIENSQQISEDQKQSFIQQIEKFTKEQLIEFLKQNNIIQSEEELEQTSGSETGSEQTQCIFCNISKKNIPSVILKENEKAIAILELNPISKGHALILPKEHISSADNIPPEVTDLSKEIDSLIKENLSPQKTLIDITSIMEHIAINIVPVYNNETLESNREQKTRQELEEIKKQLIPSDTQEKQTKKSETEEITKPQTKCPFCSIVSGSIQAYKIDDNKDSIAVLEINPISRGHSIVIPKKHLASSSDFPATAFSLAKKISRKINSKLKPKDIIINSSTTTGHGIINIIPVYTKENPESERYSAEETELKQLKDILEKKSRSQSSSKKTTKKATKKTSKKSSKTITSKNKEESKGPYSGGSYFPNRIP